jgi:hypothetical protein
MAAFGSVPTPLRSDFWRTNLEAIRILKAIDPATDLDDATARENPP